MNYGLFLISMMFYQLVHASPMPLSGSSLLNQLQSGAVLSQLGFTVQNFPSTWELKKPSEIDAVAVEMGPSDPKLKGVLNFKVDTVPSKTDLEKYVRQYLRDYNQYGFEVTGLQSMKPSGANTVIVDLNQKNRATRSRQVFYKKDEKIVTATCIDDFEKFSKTILTCNSILQSFQWR